MKLNLGCGEDIREGYCNIDIRELPQVGSDTEWTNIAAGFAHNMALK